MVNKRLITKRSTGQKKVNCFAHSTILANNFFPLNGRYVSIIHNRVKEFLNDVSHSDSVLFQK